MPPIEHEDGSVTPAADCIQCDGAGNQETIEDINARVAQVCEHMRRRGGMCGTATGDRVWGMCPSCEGSGQDERWREGIKTGEPMDLAWRYAESGDADLRTIFGAAGRAMEAGDHEPLTRLIIRIDNMGMSYSGERKAVVI